ncbi:MAG: class I tRNA ligase family protein, partial [Candidatus Thermoplasmatota archaeon]|nr:class I tRNA ligase family protein [Candidatus Thermoplasmatota archaeon]MCL5954750.1 class I tRNA ligase family protein [Candidatus Thermoplasmatota archaeon]
MELDLPSIEEKWTKHWLENDIYRYDASVRDRSRWFAIDTPPPTISGKMHMGHAFSYPHQDFIARYKRMRGFQVYYPWGFDDNGLPTERYTEKKLGIKGEQTDLVEFIRLCTEESDKAEAELLKNWMS